MIVNMGAVRRGHKRFIASNRLMFDRELRSREPAVGRHVRDHAEFNHRTDKTRFGVRTLVRRTSNGALMRITNASKNAARMEYGTRQHIIRPRNKKYLRFFSRKLGRLVFARAVHHPGTRPYRFMEAAAKYVHQTLNGTLRQSMSAIARRF